MEKNAKKSLFISFEGIDNAGKSSLIDAIQKDISNDIPVYVTKELTTEIGGIARQKLKNNSLNSYEKVLLFAADRLQRYYNDIEPRLNNRCIILADRWFFSAIAYRCAEDQSLREYVIKVNKLFLLPDLTFYIDITADESIKRGEPYNKNNYTKEFLIKVRKEYERLMGDYNFIKIDGMRNIIKIKEGILRTVLENLRYL